MLPAIRITTHISLVGSGEIGLSEGHDAHIYLVDAGQNWCLVDAGIGIHPESLVHNLERIPLGDKPITHLLLTHCHADHAGRAASLQQKYGLQIIAGSLTKARVTSGEEHDLALDAAKAQGIYPADYTFTPPLRVEAVQDGDQITIGESRFTVIETPGHSADSTSYLLENVQPGALFSGDSLFASGQLPLLNTFDSELSAYRHTIQRLAGLPFEILCPGHGLFLLKGGQRVAQQITENLSGSIYIPPIIAP